MSGPLDARDIQLANIISAHEDDKEEATWVVGLIAKGCKQKKKDVRCQMINGLWLVGQQAVDYGLVSGVIVPSVAS